MPYKFNFAWTKLFREINISKRFEGIVWRGREVKASNSFGKSYSVLFFFFFYSFCKVFDLVISIYKGFMTPYVNLETVLIICTSSPFVTPSASHLK